MGEKKRITQYYLDTLSVHNGRVHFQDGRLDRPRRRQLGHPDVDGVRSFMVQHDDLLVLVHLLLLLFDDKNQQVSNKR